MKNKPMNDPKSISIVLPKETYDKLQRYLLEEKLKGNCSFSISNLGRDLFEKWLEENT